MSENGFWETALIYASVVLTWLGGEAGRAYAKWARIKDTPYDPKVHG